MSTILKYAVVCLALTLAADSFAQTCQNWVNNVEYEVDETIIYEGDGYIANRHVYQNTPPRPEDNGWFWSPTDICDGGPPQDDYKVPRECGTGQDMIVEGKSKMLEELKFVNDDNPDSYTLIDINHIHLNWGGYQAPYTTIKGNGVLINGFSGHAKMHMGYIEVKKRGEELGTKIDGKTIETGAIVVNNIPWPDYVFKSDYKLLPLKEVENFITKNGHLPNVPSEEEVIENGVSLGDMQAKLLEKIEEMTLHMIQMQKRIDELETDINK